MARLLVSWYADSLALMWRQLTDDFFSGWKLEASIYAHRIIGLVQRMRSMLEEVLLQNSRVIQRYFQGSKWSSDLNALTLAASKFHYVTDSPLDKLIQAEMKRKETRQESVLEKLFYVIDTPESVDIVCQSLRLETVSTTTILKNTTS